jgi:G-patch domain/Zinc finger C-x8-C-x5-C-x3-H type (and similar)
VINGQSLETFHNAFIADIIEEDDDGEVFVKVFFLNPTSDDMKPCDFFFENSCTFESSCKFSHGECVAFSSLKSYQDPCYSLLKHKCHVLVKTESKLWKPATIIECSQDHKTCQVKLQSGKITDKSFSDILPPLDTRSGSDSSDLSSDDSEDEDSQITFPNVFRVDNNFGDWEKFTKGIGSKIMQKLGYVTGEGLGKRKQGICEPVSAKIYIQGKSLDFNMEHNARKGQTTVEGKLKKDSLRHQKMSEKNYSRNETDLFSLINTIGTIKPATSTVTKKSEEIASHSKAELNIANFKIEEEIKKSQKSLEKIKESLRRQKSDSATAKSIQKQIDAKESEITNLQRKLSAVNNEQKSRNEKSKLTVF